MKVVLFEASVDSELIKDEIKKGYAEGSKGTWIPVNIKINSNGLTNEEAGEINEKLTPIANELMQNIVESIEDDLAKGINEKLNSKQGIRELLDFLRNREQEDGPVN